MAVNWRISKKKEHAFFVLFRKLSWIAVQPFVLGKTYIRRVIRGLSKINGAQFLCHFSPTKPFDKIRQVGI